MRAFRVLICSSGRIGISPTRRALEEQITCLPPFLCALSMHSDSQPFVSAVVYSASFTAITRVRIPSGTPNLLSELRPLSLSIRGHKRALFGVLFAPSRHRSEGYAIPMIWQSLSESASGKKSESTAAWAARFAGPTACVYTSSVERDLRAAELLFPASEAES
jgi:hypothetical protein